MTKKKKPEDKLKVGAPSMYTKALASKICREIATSTDSISKIIQRNPGFPVREVIWAWRIDKPEFAIMYDNAKRAQADLLIEEIKDISDNSDNDTIINEQTGREIQNSEYIARSRLRVDTRKWIACKLMPKIYGDKVDTTVTIKPHEELLKELE